MDRVTQLRSEPGGSQDSGLDSTAPSEAYLTANESSKYFSLSEDDSTFDIQPMKEADATEKPIAQNQLNSNLSPISKTNNLLDGYKIGKHIEAANILSGGVNIFDDNDNSYDGNELVIDDDADCDEKSADMSLVRKEVDDEVGMVDAAIPSKDTEVVLQIDGKNVDAIDIGNGLYLYRREGEQEELAAVQIVDTDQQQPSFKFLKVRENAEGNLEVYEEFEVEVPKEVPSKDVSKNSPNLPVKQVNKPNIPASTTTDVKLAPKEITATAVVSLDVNKKLDSESKCETKNEVNFHGKPVKFNEARKSPLIGSFTPMTYHSTPNKEGIPLTKTMVDQHLHPSRHSDNAKKTIEVNTESCKQKLLETPTKCENTTDIVDVESKKTVEVHSEKNHSDDVKLKVNIDIDELNCRVVTKDSHNEKSALIEKVGVTELVEKDENQSNLIHESASVEIINIAESKSESPISEVKMKTPDNVTDNVKTLIKEKNNCSKDASLNTKPVIIPETAVSKELVETSSKIIDIEVAKKDTLVTKNINTLDEKPLSDDLAIENVDSTADKDNLKHKQTLIVQEISPLSEVEKSEANMNIAAIDAENIKPSDNVDNIAEQVLSAINVEDKLNLQMAHKEKLSEDVGNKEILPKMMERNVGIPKPISSELTKMAHKEKLCEDVGNKEILPKMMERNVGIPKPISSELTKIEAANPKDVKLANNSDTKVCHVPTESSQKSQSNVTMKPEVTKKISKTDIFVNAKIKTVDVTKPSSSVKVETSNDFINKYVHKALIIKSTPSDSADVSRSNESPDQTTAPIPKQSANVTSQADTTKSSSDIKLDTEKKNIPIIQNQAHVELKPKSLNNNAVPFGKWTEANKQEYLIKIKETKITTNNTNQIKQTNDLNRRDVLKKIDTQRQINNLAAAKTNEQANINKQHLKSETSAFASKTVVDKDEKSVSITETQKNLPESVKAAPKISVSTTQPDTANISAKNSLTSISTDTLKNKSQHSIGPIRSSEAAKDVTKQIIVPKSQQEPVKTKVSISKTETVKDPPKFSEMLRFQQQYSKTATKHASVSKSQQVAAKIAVVPKMQPEPVKVTPKHTIIPLSQPDVEVSCPNTDTEPSRVRKAQTLIDKTIEDYLIDGRPTIKFNHDSVKRWSAIREKSNDKATSYHQYYSNKDKNASIVNDIEMKMNELHGVPFVERPSHELPQRHIEDVRCYSTTESHSKVLPMTRVNKIPPLVPLANKQQSCKPSKINHGDDISDEEIIEHEPITGDIDLKKVSLPQQITKCKKVVPNNGPQAVISNDSMGSKSDSVITETEFDKFARRNSITYENCITLNYDINKQHVIQTVIEKDNISKNTNTNLINPKANKFVPIHADDAFNRSKLQMAYNSAMSAKLHKESTITTIEDKPVKVVFMDSRVEFVPSQLNVQGKDLSPAKRRADIEATSSCDSLDSDILDVSDETKSQDGLGKKYKHQRKQVLTPVEAPEMELIVPSDLGIKASPKKRRKVEDTSIERSPKSMIPKKTYLLGRNSNTANDSTYESSNVPDLANRSKSATVSAIDSLVKAAELLDNQTENTNIPIDTQNNAVTPSTPLVKRGRGRPRKYPLPEGVSPAEKTKTPTSSKKPRVERNLPKHETSSDEDSMEEGIIRENWTMGKINENIVCPICNKLFRSENVVFKHVKHCTGPSPNRSDSGSNRSPRRVARSLGNDDIDSDSDEEVLSLKKSNISKVESKPKLVISKPSDEVIVIEDTPVKSKLTNQKPETVSSKSNDNHKTLNKAKIQPKTNNLVCEFCGKTFRQLSYLVSHKMQHKNDEPKKIDNPSASNKSSVFSCEVCKKEFRKLHHLVQHRIIHNPSNMPSKMRRKSSVEQIENKAACNVELAKSSDDQSAGFRCEPCDKSFRKLHHLVEHRETHDGINRQKYATTTDKPLPQNEENQVSPTQCDVCKKTFRKLHHLIEHKEQHAEVNSEKSDDKSVRSSLSTKDIIHECPLCYMVFPNEHSLNKHSVICQRKKRQSGSKSAKPEIDDQTSQESLESTDVESVTSGKSEHIKVHKDTIIEKSIVENQQEEKQKATVDTESLDTSDNRKSIDSKKTDDNIKLETSKTVPIDLANIKDIETKPIDSLPKKNDVEKLLTKKPIQEVKQQNVILLTNPKKPDVSEIIVIEDTPKKRRMPKDKTGSSTVTKRQKTTPLPLPVIEENKPTSDEDEIRYMLNPDFNSDDTVDGKLFMKVRSKKRSSLQIERPNSKDLIKRRTSLQYPPKVPRLKAKTEGLTPSGCQQSKLIVSKANVDHSTDSDENDIKYSFPKTVAETEKKMQKKTLAERRKSLSGIAKKKSLGKSVTPRRKPNTQTLKETVKSKSLPVKCIVKKRTADAGHRCDCGQLFNSGALLARHTSLAHTPPRRRRPSPAPPRANKGKEPTSAANKGKEPTSTANKGKEPTSAANKGKEPTSAANKGKEPTSAANKGKEPTSAAKSTVKARKSIAHKGVPVPEKMRKMMERLNK